MSQASLSFVLSIVAVGIAALALFATFWNAWTNALNRRDKRHARLTVVGRFRGQTKGSDGERPAPLFDWALHNGGEERLVDPYVQLLWRDRKVALTLLCSGVLMPSERIELMPVGTFPGPAEGRALHLPSRARIFWQDGRRQRKARAEVSFERS